VVAPAVFALGQFGGCELGLSPAIDLLFSDADWLCPSAVADGPRAGSDGVPRANQAARREQIEVLLAVLQRELGASHDRAAAYRLYGSRRSRGVVELDVDSAFESYGHRASAYERRLFERIRLGASGAMDSAASARLADAYAWLRRAEHSTQLVDAGSSRCFPEDPRGQILLARCMGYREPEASRARDRLLNDRQEIRQQVQDPFEKCLLEPLR
jgi:hypothetical protein